MKTTRLGTTGLTVSRICLGMMTYGSPQWRPWILDEAASRPLVKHAVELGINFFDTADMYSAGESEVLTGKFLREFCRRDEIVIASKLYFPVDLDYKTAGAPTAERPNRSGLSRKRIFHAVDASLKRLGTDYIDLYQIHRFDTLTNIEDTLRTLDDLVHAGKVRYIGCSNLAAWQLMKALALSREQKLERFRCTQSYYSLLGRELERETIPLLKDQGLGLLVWSPLAGGFLSGKFTRNATDEKARRATFDFPPIDKEKGFDLVELMRDVAKPHGASIPQVALAWVLSREAVTSIIIGARNLAQLDDNLKSVDLVLSADDLSRLDEASRLAPEYPAWMDLMPGDRRPDELRRYE
jgi:aryl-alcohol dehydrogenase-like predicted oxidoreductase